MARTRRPLIAGNWKMNGLRPDGLTLAKGVAEGVKQAKWSDRGNPLIHRQQLLRRAHFVQHVNRLVRKMQILQMLC